MQPQGWILKTNCEVKFEGALDTLELSQQFLFVRHINGLLEGLGSADIKGEVEGLGIGQNP